MAWNIRGLENPSSDEFLNSPDLYVSIHLPLFSSAALINRQS